VCVPLLFKFVKFGAAVAVVLLAIAALFFLFRERK
jgi:hypothetical protein